MYQNNAKKVKNREGNDIKRLIARLEQILQKLKEQDSKSKTQEFEGFSDFESILVEDETPIKKQEIETVRLPKQAIRHKKEIVKQEILLQISTTNIALKELKREFVDRRKYCSKATFYRYVQELKKEQKIEKIIINNEEFVYLSIKKS